MTDLRYIRDQWRNASYAGAGLIVVVSVIFALLAGHYRLDPRLIVPAGNATSTSGLPWTLFNQPWALPEGSSASFSDTIIGIGVLIALVPVAYVSITNHRYLQSVEKNIPRFLRDVLESTDSGLILPQALVEAAKSDYGPISRQIGIAMTKFSMGYDFKASIMEAAKNLRHPFMTQVGLILAEAYSAGGRMHDVLNSSVVLFNGMEQYNESKQVELKPYTQLVYISVFIFLIISLVVISQFIGPYQLLNKTVNHSVTGLPGGSSVRFISSVSIPTSYFESVFFISAILESIFGGIVAGKIVEGSASSGLRHSIILIAVTIVVFNAPLIGIFGVG